MKKRNLGISLSYLNSILGMLFGLYLSSYLLGMLGDTEYGIYQTVCSFANYLVLLEFGIGTVITRNISICRAQNKGQKEIQKNISTLWTINVLLATLIAIVAVVFYFLIGTIYSKTLTAEQITYGKLIFVFEAVYLILSFLSSTLNGVLLGFEKYEIQPIIAALRLIVRTALLTGIVFALRKSVVIAIVDCFISCAVMAFLVLYCTRKLEVKFSFREFEPKIFREALPLCLAILIQAIVNQANNNVDKFVIGIKLNPESVTVYSVGLFVYNMFSSLTTIPISMYAPKVVAEVASGIDTRTLENHMIKPSRLIVLIGGSVLFGFIAVGKQFITLFYGTQYLVAWIIAIIIMCPMLINMSNGILINVLNAKNLRMSRSLVLLITTIGNIILTVLWIDKWGMIGASVATAICTLLGQITLMNIYYFKKLQINVIRMYYHTFKGILLYQIVSCVVSFLAASLISKTIISFIVGVIVYVSTFSILFYLFGATIDEKSMVNKVLYTVKHKSK